MGADESWLRNEEVATLRRQMDEAAILGVIRRYFYAIDRRDADALGSCFTPDCVVEYYGGAMKLAGRDAVTRSASNPAGPFAWRSHVQGSTDVQVVGDSATADIYA